MRQRRLVAGVAGILVLAAVLVAGVIAARDTGGARPVATGSGPQVELAGTDPITGAKVDLAQFAGQPVVVNVWASWCSGCNEEAADLAEFERTHPEAQVVGLDIRDTRDDARTFYRRWGWRHPSIFDPSGDLAQRLALQGLPSTFVLDSEHRIVSRIVGATDLAGFEEALRQATG
ncbi:MAG TPA: TlpA disulfide reductase family protein [Gaiellaceae bacterium]|nr:TlpA disulfide reductase family protein [Gaiellaceae bacterium]